MCWPTPGGSGNRQDIYLTAEDTKERKAKLSAFSTQRSAFRDQDADVAEPAFFSAILGVLCGDISLGLVIP